MQHETFGDILLERSTDDHPGLLFEDSSWTWREFVAEAAVRAEILRVWSDEYSSSYAERPDPYKRLHVGILLENVPEYLFTLSGAALTGVTIIGINPTRRGAELASDIRGVDCDVILTDADGSALLDGLDTGAVASFDIDSEQWRGLLADHAGAEPRLHPEDARDPHTLLALLFTSGSTGAPKAVMCSTGRMAMLGTINYRGLVRDDVAYSAMPLFHGNALFAAFAPAAYVGCTFAMRRKFSASGFLPDVLKFDATYFNYVGRSLSYILAQPEAPEEKKTRLRVVFGTEASVHDRVEFERRFGVTPLESYGSSEGGVVISHTEDTPPGALGVAGAYMDVAILDEDGKELPKGETGRIFCGNELVFDGYTNGKTKDFVDGLVSTGDMGHVEGDLYFVDGRDDDMIVSGGENVYPIEVEGLLAEHPAVREVSVIGVPDPDFGQRLAAFVALTEGHELSADEVKEHVRAHRARHCIPREVVFMDELPRNATGKILNRELRKHFA